MINAKKFYEASVKKQREQINNCIKLAENSGNPTIFLPFDTYPIIEQEMLADGWIYESYYDKNTGHKCASFSPKQYIGEE